MDIDIESTAKRIADDLFEVGREPDRQIYRIQFMSGRLGNEEGCGGLDKGALIQWLYGALTRSIPRPAQKPEVEWDGKAPHVGWHGECTWGDKAVWFECVILPAGRIAKDKYGEWEVADMVRLRNIEFRPTRTKEQRQRDELIEAIPHPGFNTKEDIADSVLAYFKDRYNLEPKT